MKGLPDGKQPARHTVATTALVQGDGEGCITSPASNHIVSVVSMVPK